MSGQAKDSMFRMALGKGRRIRHGEKEYVSKQRWKRQQMYPLRWLG